MEQTTKILVPTDFSPCSENALKHALLLSDKIKASILVLHTPQFDTSTMENIAFASEAVEKIIESAEKRLLEFVEKASENVLSSLDEKPSIQRSIETGAIELTICDVAARNQIDFIVMGTQGENSTLDKYLGSVTSNVLESAPCPIMVIPENSDFATNAVVGYATDFSHADPFEIWKAMKLFKSFHPVVKCVHFKAKQVFVEDKIKELKSYFTETAPDLDLEFYSLPAKNRVEDMNKFIEDQGINILVMYKPKRSFLESIFHRSYTQKMAKLTHIPLLVYKEAN